MEQVASKGVRAFRAGQYADAVQCFTEALEGNAKDSCKIRCNRAAAYLALGKNKKALKDANRCIEEKPAWAKAHGRKAAALFGMRKFDISAAVYMEGLAFDKNSGALKAGLKLARESRDSVLGDFSALEAAEAEGNETDDESSEDEEDKKMAAFFSDLGASTSNKKKNIPKKVRQVDDSVITNSTPMEQVERLTQKNSFWKNLNPYHVLMLPVAATDEDIKQRYHRLSAMVHPDKLEDPRARDAFIVVKNAHKTLNNKNKRENICKLINGARRTTEKTRKRLLKKGVAESTLPPLADVIAKETLKVFAQSEQRRRLAKKNQVIYTKRDREAENEEIDEEGWTERRKNRITDWRGFQDKGKSKKRKGMEIRAPEFKQEVVEGRKGASAHYDERGESHKKRWR